MSTCPISPRSTLGHLARGGESPPTVASYRLFESREGGRLEMDRHLIEAALPGYELGSEIGRGGWGVVYRARHRSLDRQAAVKVLPRAFSADTVTRDRFIDEARLGAQLDHPHIVKVLDFVEHEGLWIIVMERLGGGTLWDRFSSQGLMADEVCAIGLGLCAALESAHERNIVHRDIKPENLIFADDGTPRLADFGVAKALNVGLKRTAQGDIVGTPAYMSPEQARGHTLGPQSDVYSVGVLLHEALSGRLPFLETEDPMAMLLKHIDEIPQPLTAFAPEVSESISAVVMRCLSKDPADRYATAGQLGVALAEAAGETFGSRWLHHSGVEFRGWGPIAEAVTRRPAGNSAMRAPSVAMPAVSDHVRVGTLIEPAADQTYPNLDDVSGFSQQRSERTPAPPDGRKTVAPTAGVPPPDQRHQEPVAAGPHSSVKPVGQPQRLSVNGAPAEGRPKQRSTLRNVSIGAAVLLVALIGLRFVLSGSGPDSDPNETQVPDTQAHATSVTDEGGSALADPSMLAMADRYTVRCATGGMGDNAECLCQFLVLAAEVPAAGIETPLSDIVDEFVAGGSLPTDAAGLLEGRCQL